MSYKSSGGQNGNFFMLFLMPMLVVACTSTYISYDHSQVVLERAAEIRLEEHNKTMMEYMIKSRLEEESIRRKHLDMTVAEIGDHKFNSAYSE